MGMPRQVIREAGRGLSWAKHRCEPVGARAAAAEAAGATNTHNREVLETLQWHTMLAPASQPVARGYRAL